MNQQEHADKTFLALTIWREARGEPDEAKTAVAYCVLNRVDRPTWWGKDVMSVVFKKWQFSSMTDPKDPQLTTWPQSTDSSWPKCLSIACRAYDRALENPVIGADSYYDISLDKIGKAPKWATEETFVRQIGKIKFYNLDKDVETPKKGKKEKDEN